MSRSITYKMMMPCLFLGTVVSGTAYGVECPLSPFGFNDEIGRANLLTQEKVVQAGKLIKDGRVYELGRIHDAASNTPFPADRSFSLELIDTGTIPDSAFNDIVFNESRLAGGKVKNKLVPGALGQWASQWDALPHFGFADAADLDDSCYFNNFKQDEVFTSTGVQKMGAEKVPPFVTRGILLDIAKLSNDGNPLPSDTGDGFPYEISEQEVVDALKEQAGIKLTMKEDLLGDVILIRTGVDVLFDTQPSIPSPGIGVEAAQLLADEGVVMVGSDSFAVDVFPRPDGGIFPVHQLFLVEKGIYILENLDLEELSDAGVHKFFFSLVVNKWRGSPGSPAFPIAIGPDDVDG